MFAHVHAIDVFLDVALAAGVDVDFPRRPHVGMVDRSHGEFGGDRVGVEDRAVPAQVMFVAAQPAADRFAQTQARALGIGVGAVEILWDAVQFLEHLVARRIAAAGQHDVVPVDGFIAARPLGFDADDAPLLVGHKGGDFGR